jgi:hypothetical protein
MSCPHALGESRSVRNFMLKHLYKTSGEILFSAKMSDDTPEADVVRKLLGMYASQASREGSQMFSELYLHDLNLTDMRFDNYNFEKCTLQNVVFQRPQSYVRSNFKSCRIEHCKFVNGQVREISFTDCDLIDVDFTESYIEGYFADCRLTAVKFSAGDIDNLGISIHGGQLRGVEFSGVEIPTVENIDVKLWDFIERHGPSARHQLPLLHNAMVSILGAEWERFSERWNSGPAFQLMMIKNSKGPDAFKYSSWMPGLIEQFKRRAGNEAS